MTIDLQTPRYGCRAFAIERAQPRRRIDADEFRLAVPAVLQGALLFVVKGLRLPRYAPALDVQCHLSHMRDPAVE
ncbi:hypothetical protein EH244_20765 [Variovorax beijingensis]|uniref:Uncharacterized protein n=1 Tax=Variovorax beijingensis TaxID=2496117 RepID=A0A3P3EMM1_9BURK|nr:hypothetical protein [Variovorax beijingensis]RRH86628.1 hypothetical protein EH244_20765 [Variovorax beijingensis]